MNRFLYAVQKALSLFWYKQNNKCLICQSPAVEALCEPCRIRYFKPELERCYSCGKLIRSNKNRCRDCEEGKGPKSLTRVAVLGYYAEGWKDLIHNVKFDGQPYLLPLLEGYITRLAITTLPPPDFIVPVPMHFSRMTQRGYNQTEVLASVLSRKLGITYMEALVRNIDTIPQTSLRRKKRLQNVRGAFSLRDGIDIKERTAWLVDDVVTTGATLDECAAVLKYNGASNIYAICLAAGMDEMSE